MPSVLGLTLLIVLVASATGHAQNLRTLRELARRERHTRSEQQQVAAWLRAELAKLSSPADVGAPGRFRQVTLSLVGPDASPPATRRFVDLFAEHCSQQFPTAMKDSENDEVALILALVLAQIPSAHVSDGLIACLEHSNMGVRYWGADGLRRCRVHLAAKTAFPAARRAVAALGAAGARESNRIVLRKIYLALDYSAIRASVQGELLQEVVRAADVLVGARLKAYQAKQTAGAVADAVAVRVLVNLWLYKKTPDAEKRKLIALVSRLLQGSSTVYVEGSPAERADVAPVVAACEAELRRACVKSEVRGALPKVSKLLDDGSPQLIQLEVLKWVGSKDVKGVLNKPPFDLPPPPPFEIKGGQAASADSETAAEGDK